MTFEFADKQLIGWFAECRLHGDPLGILEAVDIVESGAADDAD
jgi:hypothetical protein